MLLRSSVDFFHQAALATSCRIGVNDTLGGRLVNALYRQTKVFLRASVDCVFYTRTKFAPDSLIAFGTLGVCDDALFLALDVCHVEQC